MYRHWPGKTITEYDDHLFCMITMNHHPLHTNEWFAEHESVQGRNVVVGNLVYSLVLGMSVPDVSGAAIANLEVETLQHKKPTFHGDTIYAETRVLDVKESASRPDRGIVTVETKGLNQDGEEVCYFRRRVMVWKRDAAPDAPAPLRRHRHLGVGRDDGPPRSGARLQRRRRRLRAGPPVVSRPRPSTWSCGSWASAAGRRVLDLGAGTGQVHRAACSAPGPTVVAVEPVAEMRAKLVAALPEVTAARRHRRGDPARRSVRRRRRRRPRPSTGSTRAGPSRDHPGAAPGRRPGARVEPTRRVRAVGGRDVQGHRVERRRRRTERGTDWAARRGRRRPGSPHAAAAPHLPLRAAGRPRDAARPRPLDQLPGRRPARAAATTCWPRCSTSCWDFPERVRPARTAPTCGSVTSAYALLLAWGATQLPRPAVAPHPRPVGRARLAS